MNTHTHTHTHMHTQLVSERVSYSFFNKLTDVDTKVRVRVRGMVVVRVCGQGSG